MTKPPDCPRSRSPLPSVGSWLSDRRRRHTLMSNGLRLLSGLTLLAYLIGADSLPHGMRARLAPAQVKPTSRWAVEASLPQAVQEGAVTALNGQVYVVGGSNGQNHSQAVLVFDPLSHQWSQRAPYPGPARDHLGIAAAHGYLYLLGGLTAWPGPAVTNLQRYDPNRDSWMDLSPLPLPRGAMGVAALNGKIYVVGGLRGGAAVNDFTVYDPPTDSWQTLPGMPTPRDHLVAVALQGKLYAIGGRGGSAAICAPIATVEVYDPATNTWSQAASLNTARGGHAAGTLNGRIQVFGGEGESTSCGIIASAEEYDPASDAWSLLPAMLTPRHGTGGATIGDSIYLPGGALITGNLPTPVHERFDQSLAPQANPGTPYHDTPSSIPGIIQAEDFDQGGEGVAYHDADPGNNGGQYRQTDVDLEVCGDAGGGYDVGWVRPGEWLNYTVNVTAPATYTIGARVASPVGGGTFHIEFDGIDQTGTLAIPDTGSWQSYQTLSKSGISLSAGLHTMRIVMDSSGPNGYVGNFNFISLASESAPTPSPNITCRDSPLPVLYDFTTPIAGTYAGTGFNCFLPGTIPPDAAATGLTLGGFNGKLTVTSTAGDVYLANNNQHNALALKFANSGSYAVRVRIKGPLMTTSQYQSGGVFLALDADNYAKFVVGHIGSGGRLEFALETGGSFADAAPDVSFDLGQLDSHTKALDLWLVRRSDGQIEALYRTLTNDPAAPVFGPIISAGTITAPAWSLSSDHLYGGILTTNYGSDVSFNTIFDEFSLGPPISASAPPSAVSLTTKVER